MYSEHAGCAAKPSVVSGYDSTEEDEMFAASDELLLQSDCAALPTNQTYGIDINV